MLLGVLTAPPNYQWQILLERWFPAYARTSPASDNSRDGRDIEKEPGRQAEDASGKPKLNMRNTLIKWFVDCITLGALWNTVAFLLIMGLMKGQDMGEIGQNLTTVSAMSCESACDMTIRRHDRVVHADTVPQETIPIIVDSYKIWPIASFVSFSYVPVERRIVFLSFIGFLWGIYMSLVAAKI